MKTIKIIRHGDYNLNEEVEEYTKVRSIYYPNYVFEIDMAIKRLIGEPKIIKRFVTVDLLRNRAMLSDSFPALKESEVGNKEILPDLVEHSKALHIAKRKCLHSILTKVMTLYGPEYKIIKEEKAYKEFIILYNGQFTKILDTLSGHIKDAENDLVVKENTLQTSS